MRHLVMPGLTYKSTNRRQMACRQGFKVICTIMRIWKPCTLGMVRLSLSEVWQHHLFILLVQYGLGLGRHGRRGHVVKICSFAVESLSQLLSSAATKQHSKSLLSAKQPQATCNQIKFVTLSYNCASTKRAECELRADRLLEPRFGICVL